VFERMTQTDEWNHYLQACAAEDTFLKSADTKRYLDTQFN
jgi:hypothetical protein